MSWTPGLQWVASATFERLVYCAIEGSLLAIVVSLGLRFIPRKSSRTIFVIWFSALVASAVLPLLAVDLYSSTQTNGSPAAITIPVSIAFYLLIAWITVAIIGLLRVGAGIFEVRRLKLSGRELQPERIGNEPARLIQQFQNTRRVSILVSDRVQVPTAIGFFKAAIILPEWMAEEGSTEELKHVLLHELNHLRRRDDWTNLIQKIVKALLFFNPGVWWMERELSLHREIACDDAVLAQTSSPQTYAECLARVAEKSFLRRQIAMAQAAVSRVRQLTVRVARILDPNRAASTHTWKPSVPAVAALALISGISVAHAPELVRVNDGANSVAGVQQSSVPAKADAVFPASAPVANVRAWKAGFKTAAAKPSVSGLKATFAVAKQSSQDRNSKQPIAPKVTQVRARHERRSPQILAYYKEAPLPEVAGQGSTRSEQGEFVLIVETQQTITAAKDGWHVSVQQTRWLVPVRQIQKPIPGKI